MEAKFNTAVETIISLRKSIKLMIIQVLLFLRTQYILFFHIQAIKSLVDYKTERRDR
jgi:hypothetical protein